MTTTNIHTEVKPEEGIFITVSTHLLASILVSEAKMEKQIPECFGIAEDLAVIEAASDGEFFTFRLRRTGR